jgi:histidine triad (HIT) family protein
MEKCIFCEIVGKRVPSFTVYEDENFVAFLDVNPLNKGHALVVPKKHVRWTWDVENFGEYFEVAKAVGMAAMKALDAKWVNFITAGMGVPHAHIHIVPRFENDGHPELPVIGNTKKVEKEEMVQIAEKIKSEIAKNPPKKSVKAVEKVEVVKEEPKVEKTRSDEDIAYMRREMESG